MTAMIERNPRQGVELRERSPEALHEVAAAVACFWLVGTAGFALLTGHVLPLAVCLVACAAGACLAGGRR